MNPAPEPDLRFPSRALDDHSEVAHPEQWTRCFRHPERGIMHLDQMVALYAWHSRHHVAHVTGLRKRMGW